MKPKSKKITDRQRLAWLEENLLLIDSGRYSPTGVKIYEVLFKHPKKTLRGSIDFEIRAGRKE